MLSRLFTVLSTLSLLLCAVVVGGCGCPPQPVALQAYHAVTNEPLGSVVVNRWDFEDAEGESVTEVYLGTTGGDGLVTSPVGRWEPSFMFYKEGFSPAEVRVEGASAYVASPSSGNRRYRMTYPNLERLPPTKYEKNVPARPLIRVPMWPNSP